MNERRGGDLLLFFSGWGMDPRPFRFLGTGESDVLLLFDYRKGGESPDFGSLFSSYDRVMLVAWSLGVAVANRVVREWAGRLADAVAINGTTRPVDEQFGIPADVFDGTIENLYTGGLKRFMRRMCGSRACLDRFGEHLPERDVNGLGEELVRLRHWGNDENRVFHRARVGRRDRIFEAGNQQRCWQACGVRCLVTDEPHFPFYSFRSWEDMTDAGPDRR